MAQHLVKCYHRIDDAPWDNKGMKKLAHLVMTLCFAVVGACLALVLYAAAGIGAVEAGLFGLIAFAGLMLAWSRFADRSLLRQVLAERDKDRRRIDGVFERVDARIRSMEVAPGRNDSDQALTEIATLGAVVKDLADAVAGQEARFATLSALSARAMPIVTTPSMPVPPAVAPPPMAVTVPAPVAAPPSIDADPPSMVVLPPPPEPVPAAPAGAGLADDVIEAVEAARVEIQLQPIVSLPQRKVRLYEASAVLRTRDGRSLATAEVEPAALALGHASALDGTLILRTVQIARKLATKNRELLVACRLSAGALFDRELVAEIAELLEATPGLGPQLALLFDQAAFEALTPADHERLKPILAAGARFGLDSVAELRLDGRSMAARGVRFVRIAAPLLLDPPAAARSEIHAADLAGLLARFGVELIAGSVDSEALVADLLDYEVKLGQGSAFGPARTVRPEVLADAPALPVRPAAPPPPPRPTATAVPAPPSRPQPAPPLLAIVPQPEPRTLGEAALHGAIDKLRKSQEERDAAPPTERRSAWSTLARRIGSTEKRSG
jgi:cyclic-di-GMP phosphodiesterase TipF (flagellum assembly factor)